MARYKIIWPALALVLALTACGEQTPPPKTPVPAPALPTTTPAMTVVVAEPDLARGRQVWLDKQCAACHGNDGQGGVARKLAGTTEPFDKFLHVVRTGVSPMPAYNAAELPDQDAYNTYRWLQEGTDNSVEKVAPPALPAGETLGMTLWTQYDCDSCHGSFAQGGVNAPGLTGLTYPYELERAKMRQTEADIPEHGANHIQDDILKRLYQWLQAGANPQDGC